MTLSWREQPDIEGLTGNYTPFVLHEGGRLEIYGNTDGKHTGSWYRRRGDLTAVGEASMVLPAAAIHDQSGEPLIRTTAVARGASGRYYAILHVGHGYPSQTGYVPAFAISDDGEHWRYQGKLVIEGAIGDAYSSGANLIVQENKPPVPNHEQLGENRFLFWDDAMRLPDGVRRLVAIYSADGENWYFHRHRDGEIVEHWPSALPDDRAVFPAACRTPFGFHLITADRFPSTAHRHLYSTDAVDWKILEHTAATHIGSKGTNLAFDPTTGSIHAITAGRRHRTLKASAF